MGGENAAGSDRRDPLAVSDRDTDGSILHMCAVMFEQSATGSADVAQECARHELSALVWRRTVEAAGRENPAAVRLSVCLLPLLLPLCPPSPCPEKTSEKMILYLLLSGNKDGQITDDNNDRQANEATQGRLTESGEATAPHSSSLLLLLSSFIPLASCPSCSVVPATLKSLKELSEEPALWFHIASVCLSSVLTSRGELANFPTKLPGGKAQQFRIGTSMAEALKRLGYPNELGYEAFLYPVEGTLKKLLRFLVDKLPKPESDGRGADDSVAGAGGAVGLGAAQINKALKEWMSAEWNVLAYRGAHARPSFPIASVALSVPSPAHPSKDALAYFAKQQPLVSAQPRSAASLAPSVLALHTLELVRKENLTDEFDRKARNAESAARIRGLMKNAFGNAIRAREQYLAANRGGDLSAYAAAGAGGARSAFGRKQDFETDKSASSMAVSAPDASAADGQSAEEREAALRAERERQLSELQSQLDELMASARSADVRAEELAAQSRQMESELSSAMQSSRELEDAYLVKKRTLDLLPDAANNLAELQRLVAASSERLLSLASEWESHRVPLVNKIRRARLLLAERKSEMGLQIERIKRIREEMKEKASDLREKEKLAKLLAEELNALPKSINRQVYVKRIMDLMRNIDKQKASIAAVLADVRQVAKDINLTSEASRRSFAVADEVVFQSAKKNPKDDVMTRTYKYVVNLREGFVELVAGVEAKGKAENDILSLQTQIDDIEGRNTALNLERIEGDLAQVKKENKQLQAKIKANK